VLLLLALVSLVGMPYTVLMPIFAGDVLQGGPHTLGFLMGATGVGALVGAIALAARKSVLGLGRLIVIAAFCFGGGLIAFSASRVFPLSMVLLFITGYGMMTQMASTNTILQTIVTDQHRGRVMSYYAMAFVGMAPFGSMLAGALASNIGAPYTLLAGGICCCIGATLFAVRLDELRKAVHPIYVELGILTEVATGIQSASELRTPPEG
jgi:MFS family permease